MAATASSQVLTSVRTVGGLLPADMLLRIAEGKDVSGSRPADYHVVGVRSVQAAAERHWDFLKGAWRALRDAIGDDECIYLDPLRAIAEGALTQAEHWLARYRDAWNGHVSPIFAESAI